MFSGGAPCSNRLRYAQLSEDGRSWDHSFYEGLVAEIVNSEGHRVSLHRTYLDKGRKAPVKAVKKVLGKELSGCAVRLAETDESGVLGLAEGIETALSASELFGVPVWSVVAAFNFRNFVPPKSVRRIIIFGDSDKNFIGQREAYAGALKSNSGIPTLRSKSVCPSNRDVTGMTFSWLKTKQARCTGLFVKNIVCIVFYLTLRGLCAPAGRTRLRFFIWSFV